MKKLHLLLTCIFLGSNFLLFGQVQKTKSSPTSSISEADMNKLPFEKGKWEWDIAIPKVSYSHQNVKTNDVDEGDQSNLSLDLGTTYYFRRGLGIGLEFNAGLNTRKDMYKQTNNSWMGYVDFTYGKQLSTDIDFYARVGVGLGGTTYKFTPVTGASNTDKTKLFGIKGMVGFPMRLDHNGPVYFTPELFYSYQRGNFDGGTDTDNGFGLNLKLETFLFCKQMQCDSHSGYSLSNNMYHHGHSYFGVETHGSLAFGSTETVYDNVNFNNTDKEKYTRVDLSANYMYYVVNNLSLGLDVNFNDQVTKSGGTTVDYKNTNTGSSVMPMFQLNIPSKNHVLNNFFIMGGAGFGGQKYESQVGSNTTTTKYSTSAYCGGVGYNCFFHKNLCLTPKFEYEWSTLKNKDNDQKQKYDGPEIVLGVSKFF